MVRVTVPRVVRVMLERGRLATLRTYPYRAGSNVIVKYTAGLEERRVKALVEEVIENPSPEVLEEYLDISGFDSAKEWWLTAVSLHKREPRYLVVLSLQSTE